jgi:hypothetical protein
MAGPQNAIIGDDYSTDIPVTQVDEKELNLEKKAARFSKSAEFKRIEDHMNARIEFYQRYMPSGQPITTAQPTGEDWRVANTVIKELQGVIDYYKTAAEMVKEAEK